MDRGSNKAEREAAFQKLQSERVAKNLEEDREPDAEERQERKQIRQDEVRCLEAPRIGSLLLMFAASPND